MAVEWPITLPQSLLINGYSRTPPKLVSRTNMEVGPPKLRRRYTAGMQSISGAINVTSEQLATFNTFYNDTLLGGALRFSWYNPETRLDSEFIFTNEPSISSLSGDIYKIEMELGILP